MCSEIGNKNETHERTHDVAAAHARELDQLEHREDRGPPGDDAGHLHERVEVHLAQLAQLVRDRELRDAHVDLVVDVRVVGELVHHLGHGHLLVGDARTMITNTGSQNNALACLSSSATP